MADRKVTDLDLITSVNTEDFLYVVHDPDNTPTSTKVTFASVFGSVPSDTTFTQDVTVEGTTTLGDVNITGEFDIGGGITDTSGAILDRLQVANAHVYMEVANVVNVFAPLESPVLTGTGSAETFNIDVLQVVDEKGLRLDGGGIGAAVPASSNASVESVAAGTIWYSNNHLYIAVSSDTIKRVALEAGTSTEDTPGGWS